MQCSPSCNCFCFESFWEETWRLCEEKTWSGEQIVLSNVKRNQGLSSYLAYYSSLEENIGVNTLRFIDSENLFLRPLSWKRGILRLRILRDSNNWTLNQFFIKLWFGEILFLLDGSYTLFYQMKYLKVFKAFCHPDLAVSF